MRCQPCWERKQIEKHAVKDIMGTPMCRACFTGEPDKKLFECGGHPPCPPEAAMRIVKPFLKHAFEARCSCGKKKLTRNTYCSECRVFRDNVIRAKCWIRKWVETKDQEWLTNAARLIEKKSLQPQDFLRT